MSGVGKVVCGWSTERGGTAIAVRGRRVRAPLGETEEDRSDRHVRTEEGGERKTRGRNR